ncbi:chorismate--pyruvate lyase family protein [Arhodomonas sp. AD133]|uniref:chorismate--pyruvate lyase family protein n=1 Tax=Arhodomonas sp. AD133 TaxID=3415009 RepID=UPI003EBB1882
MRGIGGLGARNWRPAGAPTGAPPPPTLRAWITAPGSLTERMRRHCHERFRVAVLGERWERPWRDEAVHLGLRPQRRVWMREVLLCDGATPWIYARTIVPAPTLRGRLRRLRALGGAPLASILFGRSPLERGPIEVTALTPADRLFAAATRHCNGHPRWARRSVFHAGQRSLLVTEVFLPALLEWMSPWR